MVRDQEELSGGDGDAPYVTYFRLGPSPYNAVSCQNPQRLNPLTTKNSKSRMYKLLVGEGGFLGGKHNLLAMEKWVPSCKVCVCVWGEA